MESVPCSIDTRSALLSIAMPKGETSGETLEQSCMAGTEAADSAILRDGKGLRTPRTLSGTLVGSSKADTELASARTKIINAFTDDKEEAASLLAKHGLQPACNCLCCFRS